MFQVFYPDAETVSTYDINFKKLYGEGIRGVIFDIDNTLVPHGAPADPVALNLFAQLTQLGIKTVLLSNNKEPRVREFGDAVVSDYIFKAGKPSVRNYIKAMERMGTDRKSTIFIGDQLFTDIWGAKKAGIPTILVHPIHPKEEIQIVLKRYLERFVLYFYHRHCSKK